MGKSSKRVIVIIRRRPIMSDFALQFIVGGMLGLGLGLLAWAVLLCGLLLHFFA